VSFAPPRGPDIFGQGPRSNLDALGAVGIGFDRASSCRPVANTLGAVAELAGGAETDRLRDGCGALAQRLQPGRPCGVEEHLMAFAVRPPGAPEAPRPGGATKRGRARQRRG
jgi:hypothetical protein